MFDSITVSQIKEYADRGYRVYEISNAFQISRNSVTKIVKGQTHPNVRPAGHVKDLDKMAEDVATAKRHAKRVAERERKKQEEATQRALDAIFAADPVVLDARRRAAALNEAMDRTHSAEEWKDLRAELAAVNEAAQEASAQARARAGL